MFFGFKNKIKNTILIVLNHFYFLRIRKYWGYHFVPINKLIINFIFQRIFRINNKTKWSVCFTSCVIEPTNIKIGRNVGKSFAVSGCCYIQGMNGIEIGDNTIFSFGVGIISADHDFNDFSKKTIVNPIIIGANCWIGKNATILPGVVLGNNCIVGAGAVVTKSFPSNSIIGGVPAKLLS